MWGDEMFRAGRANPSGSCFQPNTCIVFYQNRSSGRPWRGYQPLSYLPYLYTYIRDGVCEKQPVSPHDTVYLYLWVVTIDIQRVNVRYSES